MFKSTNDSNRPAFRNEAELLHAADGVLIDTAIRFLRSQSDNSWDNLNRLDRLLRSEPINHAAIIEVCDSLLNNSGGSGIHDPQIFWDGEGWGYTQTSETQLSLERLINSIRDRTQNEIRPSLHR